jgi:hypothetical protein
VPLVHQYARRSFRFSKFITLPNTMMTHISYSILIHRSWNVIELIYIYDLESNTMIYVASSEQFRQSYIDGFFVDNSNDLG